MKVGVGSGTGRGGTSENELDQGMELGEASGVEVWCPVVALQFGEIAFLEKGSTTPAQTDEESVRVRQETPHSLQIDRGGCVYPTESANKRATNWPVKTALPPLQGLFLQVRAVQSRATFESRVHSYIGTWRGRNPEYGSKGRRLYSPSQEAALLILYTVVVVKGSPKRELARGWLE